MAILRNTQITGSFRVSGSFVIPTAMPGPDVLSTGSAFYSIANLYIYNGTTWGTASLS